MKKVLISFLMVLASLLSAEYAIGDVCENISFTTEDGLETSIYEQVDQEKVVLIFWGSSG
ncbi:MAG: hypothetical protein CR982_07015 [Candidatus Cloacimonadota bacterium]|nr:MAG: hypothetical protein CR982_07015 [Candidatus Cloacimonadota bacterium]PIE80651.1 MAG: hypothetical protein CSA15_01750 [Candidatus Delongbacteria bacterium]